MYLQIVALSILIVICWFYDQNKIAIISLKALQLKTRQDKREGILNGRSWSTAVSVFFFFSFLVSFGCIVQFIWKWQRTEKPPPADTATLFLGEDSYYIIGNYIHSNMMLKVSIFSAWMIIVQIIGFGSSPPPPPPPPTTKKKNFFLTWWIGLV